MTKKTSSKRNTTLDSLLNTLMTYWEKLLYQNHAWQRVREKQIRERKKLEKVKDRNNDKRRDYDIFNERITWNDGMLVVHFLVEDLIVVLETNPYPEETKKVVTVADELFPSATVNLVPGTDSAGEELWKKILIDAEIVPELWITFPVKDCALDVAEIEKLLLEKVGEDGTLLASEVPGILNMNAQGKAYRQAKVMLKERDWRWVVRRIEGEATKLVIAPGFK